MKLIRIFHLFYLGFILILFVYGSDYPQSQDPGKLQVKQKPDVNLSSVLSQDYMGEMPPDSIPVIFMPDSISKSGRFERTGAFSPDGTEFFFMVTNAGWTSNKIWYSKFLGSGWSKPEIAWFSRNTRDAEPCFSPDGKRLYFTSNRSPGSGWNYDFWMSEKADTGWLEPARLGNGVNTYKGEWHPCPVKDYSLYFARDADIYVSRYVDGSYQQSQKVQGSVNTSSDEWDPFVSPDETYMIFKSNRAGGYGDMDMYISYRNADSTWGDPVNMGPEINTQYHDDSGDVTFDGKYIFFARKTSTSEMDIYWVSAGIIDKLNPSTGMDDLGSSTQPKGFKLYQNYPNPFNPETNIAFNISDRRYIIITVYDSTGSKIEVLLSESVIPGEHTIDWNAADCSSGVYYIAMTSGNITVVQKALLIK